MQSRGIRAIIIVLVLAVLAYAAWQTWKPHTLSVVRSITGNGVIEATEVDVTSKVAGKIQYLPFHEGDDVRAGQLIATLEADDLLGQVTASQGNMKSMDESYKDLAAGTRPQDIDRLRAQYLAATDQYHAATDQATAATAQYHQAVAMRDLVYAGPRPEQKAQLLAAYKQAVAARDLVYAGPRVEEKAQLRAAYQQALAQRDLVYAGTRPEEVAQTNAALQQAQAALTKADNDLKRYKDLFAAGAIPRQQLDQAQEAYDTAAGALTAAQQKLAEAQRGARPQEKEAADQAVAAALARLQEAEHGPLPQEREQADQAVNAAQALYQQALNGPRPQERAQADATMQAAQHQAQAAQTTAQAAMQQMQAAKAALELGIAGPTGHALAAAQGRVEQAQGQLQTSTATDKQTQIFAPTDGRVTLRNLEPGDLETPGLPIIRLAELRTVWIRVYVPEEQLGLIQVGQHADVTTDAFTRHHYTGRVIEISQQPEFTPKNVQTQEERVKLVYGVKVEVDNPEKELKQGMPGDATIYVR